MASTVPAGWRAGAPFDAVECGIVLRDGHGEPTTFRVRGRTLETGSVVDARALSDDPSWLFLRLVQDVLAAVADRYDLGDPPLDGPGEPDEEPGFPLPPVDHDAAADVGADVAALQDDEVLVVIPSQLPWEDERRLLDRRQRVDAALTEIFRAPPRASSATGNAYVFVLGLPGRRRRTGSAAG